MQPLPLPKSVQNILYSVIGRVTEAVSVSKVYLFGSYYTGTNTKGSDLDIAFFIKSSESLKEANRKIIKITSKYPIDIQPQIFYESELEEGIGIVGEILENGGEIFIERKAE